MWGDIVGGGSFTEVARSGIFEPQEDPTPKAQKQPEPTPKNDPEGIFSDCRFYFQGFARKKVEVLCNHLLPQGAEVVGSLDELPSPSSAHAPRRLFMIVPHDLPTSQHPTLPESSTPIETITVWWVERCLHYKKFVEPSEHVVGRPFTVFPIPEFRGMTICSSAFSGIDLLHFKKSVELLGAKYSEDMTPQCSVLVNKSHLGLRKDKYEHAVEWKIPIVAAEWLWECIRNGSRVEPKPYCYRSTKSQKRSKSLTTGDVLPAAKEPQQERTQKLATAEVIRANSLPPKAPEQAPEERPEETAEETTKETTEPTEPTEEPSKEPSQGLDTSTSFITAIDAFDDNRADKSFTAGKEIPPSAPSEATFDPSCRTEPLSERDPNSPSKTVSTAPAPSGHPNSKPDDEDISNDISNLLAKAKAPKPSSDSAPDGRKRTTKRILGRVTSNLSTISVHSRSASVDSTITPVEKTASDDQLAQFLRADGKEDKDVDSQPPSTQIQYEDPDSRDVSEKMRAQMNGQKPPPKRVMKERAVTLGMTDMRRATRQSRMR